MMSGSVRRLLLILPLMGGAALSSPAPAVIEITSFEQAELEQRYHGLIAELRCMVCQNQNLADSDAPLAKDLRRKTEEMLKQGKSDEEIISYMRERYGDFVLYRPPFDLRTAALWLGPFVLLFAALCGLALHIRRSQQAAMLRPASMNNDTERTKVRNLLKNAPELTTSGETGKKQRPG